MTGWAVEQTYYDSVNHDALLLETIHTLSLSLSHTHTHTDTHTQTQSFTQCSLPHFKLQRVRTPSVCLIISEAVVCQTFLMTLTAHVQTASCIIYRYQAYVKHHITTVCVSVCVHVSLFTGLLSRSACGVEYPLTLSCTQRNDSAWDTTLGNGEEKARAKA